MMYQLNINYYFNKVKAENTIKKWRSRLKYILFLHDNMKIIKTSQSNKYFYFTFITTFYTISNRDNFIHIQFRNNRKNVLQNIKLICQIFLFIITQ